jgi:hypothetical protein
MTTAVGVLGAALVCTWVASCGGAAGQEAITVGWDSGTLIDFVPSVVSATRYPSVCGVANPPFMNGDLFSLDIVGAATTGGPDNSLSLTLNIPAPPAGAPMALSVLPVMPQGISVTVPVSGPTTYYSFQRATGTDRLNFVYRQGTNPSEIDTGAFDAIIFTLVQLPTKDGDPFAVVLQIHFVDARELDHTYSSPLTTEAGGCPQP